MSAYDLLLIVLVAVAAFGAGYQIGRFKALTEGPGSGSGRRADDGPLTGPSFDGSPAAPQRPRSAPPPATAGGSSDSDAPPAPSESTPMRRSTKPPPAAAGLMGKGSLGKDSEESK
jgi:hypothetical protein